MRVALQWLSNTCCPFSLAQITGSTLMVFNFTLAASVPAGLSIACCNSGPFSLVLVQALIFGILIMFLIILAAIELSKLNNASCHSCPFSQALIAGTLILFFFTLAAIELSKLKNASCHSCPFSQALICGTLILFFVTLLAGTDFW